MSAQDFFYITVAVSFVVLAGFLSFAAFHLVKTLKSIKHVVDAIGETTDEISALKDGIKVALLKLAGNVVKNRAKRRWLK